MSIACCGPSCASYRRSRFTNNISHRLVRWFAIYFIALAAVASFGVLALLTDWASASLLALGGLAIVALAHRLGVGPVRQACDILLAMLGVGVGVVRSFRGDRFAVWNPAVSVRAARTIVEPGLVESGLVDSGAQPQRPAMR